MNATKKYVTFTRLSPMHCSQFLVELGVCSMSRPKGQNFSRQLYFVGALCPGLRIPKSSIQSIDYHLDTNYSKD